MSKFRFNYYIFLSVLISICLVISYFTPLRYDIIRFLGRYSSIDNCPNCSIYFPDVVSIQEQAYRFEGINKQKTFVQLDGLYRDGVLKNIKSNDDYIVEYMQYSRPYVLPKVVEFLEDLVVEYKKGIDMKGLCYFPFTITSATRSIKSANELIKSNEIARSNSHHLYGKTIDISYKCFGGNRDRQEIFIEALRKLRLQKRCYVKYEESGALHLTVR